MKMTLIILVMISELNDCTPLAYAIYELLDTQGALALLATLGFALSSRWDEDNAALNRAASRRRR